MNTTGIIGHARQLKLLDLLLASGKIPQTMLFSGMPGIGKRLVARRFLAALFCSAVDPPCHSCPSCLQAAGGTHPDIIEMGPDEKGAIPIGEADGSEPGSVRWLIDRLSKKSISGTYGVIIDGAESMSRPGQNALLKTIEEPQAGAHIILVTAGRSLILPTIFSRSMYIPFSPLSPGEIIEFLSTRGAAESGDPALVAELSGGSIEAALHLGGDDTLAGIAGICGEIASHLTSGESIELDIAPLQKKFGTDLLLSILVNIYRTLLISAITGTQPHPFLASLGIDDRERTVKIIKILLALRKGLANNLNIRNALKGMIYSIDGIKEFGLPGLDGAGERI
ncbi:MAG: hypothetical protein JW838_08985 [Spirochaetes bacterium]|nr:hypothetical protein [Spirochaetota bacterium]